VVVWVTWVGPIRTGWFSVSDLVRPASIALGLALLAALGRAPLEQLGRSRIRAVPAALALTLGIALGAALPELDRRELRAQLVAAPAVSAGTPAAPLPAARGQRDVILILVDTLRADALGSYGASPSPSPFLDELLDGAVVFERVLAASPWTFPATASLLTGRYPSRLDPLRRGGPYKDDQPMPRIPDAVPRLALALKQAGYRTAGVQKNPFLAPGSGVEAGFDVYEMVGGDRAERSAGAQITGAALRIARGAAELRQGGDERPFFLYLHYMDPHADYRPPSAYLSEAARAGLELSDGSARSVKRLRRREAPADDPAVQQLRVLYRDEVRYLDDQLARLALGLEQLGFWEDTVRVLTADHGEQFSEHGSFEHQDLHVENLHVPLAIAAPGLAPARVPALASGVDLAPTLVSLLGLPPLPDVDGRDLLGRADAPGLQRVVISEFGDEQRATTEDHALLTRPDSAELFATRKDPAETRNRAARFPQQLAALQAALALHQAATSADSDPSTAPDTSADSDPSAAPDSIDPATREALEALGYLDE
jgi:arylsulfatase A-like enzyme